MTERHCRAMTGSGAPCRTTFGLCEACGHCASHCEHRRGVMRAARVRGGAATRHRGKTAKAIRVLRPADLPAQPLSDMDGVIAWLIRLATLTLTGRVDPATSRETNRVLTTLKEAFRVRDLLARIKALEQKLREYERERVA